MLILWKVGVNKRGEVKGGGKMFICGGCCDKCLYNKRCRQQLERFVFYGTCEICGEANICYECGKFTRKGKTVKEIWSAERIKFFLENICPANCRFISPTEDEQDRLKAKHFYTPHTCLKFNKNINHGIFHPRLIKCEECKND
jgi:hypothetical protein